MVYVDDGELFYLCWDSDDVFGGGFWDEFGIDNIGVMV